MGQTKTTDQRPVEIQVVKKDSDIWQSVVRGQRVGIFEGLANEDYHKIPVLGNSGLKEFSKHPAAYQRYLKRVHDDSETPAQRCGTLFHMAVLEPKEFHKAVVVEDRRTNVNKALIEQAQAEGNAVMTLKEREKACRMRDAVLQNKTCASLLKDTVSELTLVWDMEIDTIGNGGIQKIRTKVRPDALHLGDWVSVDLKSFGTLDSDEIARQIAKSRYHWQAQLYRMGVQAYSPVPIPETFLYIFCTDEDEPEADVFELDVASLEKAASQINPILWQMADCQAKNVWPGRPEGIKPISLPSWSW